MKKLFYCLNLLCLTSIMFSCSSDKEEIYSGDLSTKSYDMLEMPIITSMKISGNNMYITLAYDPNNPPEKIKYNWYGEPTYELAWNAGETWDITYNNQYNYTGTIPSHYIKNCKRYTWKNKDAYSYCIAARCIGNVPGSYSEKVWANLPGNINVDDVTPSTSSDMELRIRGNVYNFVYDWQDKIYIRVINTRANTVLVEKLINKNFPINQYTPYVADEINPIMIARANLLPYPDAHKVEIVRKYIYRGNTYEQQIHTCPIFNTGNNIFLLNAHFEIDPSNRVNMTNSPVLW